MKDFILLIKTEIKRDYIFLKRYPLEVIGSACFFYFVFLLTSFSAKFVYSKLDKEPMFLGNTMEGWIIGCLMWMFGTSATLYMSEQWNNEAMTGTLEQLYISNSNPIYILLARILSTFFYILSLFPLAFYLFQISTRTYLNLKFFSILPILVLTFMGLCGFGFILAGITLIFKRIGTLFLILPFFPFGLAALPIENLSGNLQILAGILPLAQGVKLIRLVVLQNQGFIVLFINGEILILLLNSLFYLLIGMFGYKILEQIAKDKGLLGHY